MHYWSWCGQQELQYARTPWAAYRWPHKMFTYRTSGGRTNASAFSSSGWQLSSGVWTPFHCELCMCMVWVSFPSICSIRVIPGKKANIHLTESLTMKWIKAQPGFYPIGGWTQASSWEEVRQSYKSNLCTVQAHSCPILSPLSLSLQAGNLQKIWYGKIGGTSYCSCSCNWSQLIFIIYLIHHTSRFPSFSTSQAIVCLPEGLRLRTLSCLTLRWLKLLQLPFHCY